MADAKTGIGSARTTQEPTGEGTMGQEGVRRFAHRVSLLFNPMVIGVPVLLIIGVKDAGEIRLDLVPTILLCVGLMCILPLVYVLALMRAGVLKDFHITDRRQRVYLFPVLLICLVLVLIILYRTEGVSPLVRNMLTVGLVDCVLCALITTRFKISLHCAGVGWMVVGLLRAFGPGGFAVGLAGLGLAAWSRLVLREHTVREVLAGSLLGVGLTWVIFRILYG